MNELGMFSGLVNPPRVTRAKAPPTKEKHKFYPGDQVGDWLLIKYEPGSKSRNAKWVAQCSCGEVRRVIQNALGRGKSLSCGHHQRLEYTPGMQIGDWTLLEYLPGHKSPERVDPRWKCRCRCGAEACVYAKNLRAGVSRGCHRCAVAKTRAKRY